MNAPTEQVFDAALAELIGGKAAPDLSAAILARSHDAEQTLSETVEPRPPIVGPWRRRMWLGLELMAAASLLFVVWLVWFQPKDVGTPGTPMKARNVVAAPGAEVVMDGKVVTVTRGWLLLGADASPVNARGTMITEVKGRVLVASNAFATADIESLAGWFKQNDLDVGLKDNQLEIRMLGKLTKAFLRGSIAIWVLTGSVMVDGMELRAEVDVAPPPPDKPAFASNAEELAALDEGITDLSCLGMTESDLAGLSRFKNLRILKFNYYGPKAQVMAPEREKHSVVTNKVLELIGEMKQLHTLDVAGCMDFTAGGVAKLATLPELRSLNMSRTTLTGGVVDALGKFPALQELRLGDCRYDNDGHEDEDFKALSDIAGLRSLDLANSDYANDALLAHVGRCKALETLQLRGCYNIGDAGIRAIAGLGGLRTLALGGKSYIFVNPKEGPGEGGTTSHWAYVDASPAAMRLLGGMGALEFLTLDSCKGVDDSVLEVLANIAGLRELRVPYCCNVTDAGVAHLAKLRGLETLSLAHCKKVGEPGFKAIAEITNLRTLDLDTDAHMAKRSFAPGDEWLGNDRLQITDEGLRALRPLVNLESLNLNGHVDCSAKGLEPLLYDLTNLRKLTLRYSTAVTPNMIASVFSRMSRLETLDLRDCAGIGDSAATLDALAKLGSLKYLYMKLSGPSLKKLNDAIPGLAIDVR